MTPIIEHLTCIGTEVAHMPSGADCGAFEARGSAHDACNSSNVIAKPCDGVLAIDTKSNPTEKVAAKKASKKSDGIDTVISSCEHYATRYSLGLF